LGHNTLCPAIIIGWMPIFGSAHVECGGLPAEGRLAAAVLRWSWLRREEAFPC